MNGDEILKQYGFTPSGNGDTGITISTGGVSIGEDAAKQLIKSIEDSAKGSTQSKQGSTSSGSSNNNDDNKDDKKDKDKKASENDLDDGLGTYKDQKGHHPMAKKAFEGVDGYDPDSALTISQAKLEELGASHSKITGQQNSLYTEYAKTGQPLTMNAMREIEIKAMTNAGVSLEKATYTVDKAIEALQKAGVTQPVKIPWN